MWRLSRNQRGITGLEAAVVLMTFVVFASVISLVIFNTGLLSSEKSERAVLDPTKAPPEGTQPPDIQRMIAEAVKATRQAMPIPTPTAAPAPTFALPAQNPAVMTTPGDVSTPTLLPAATTTPTFTPFPSPTPLPTPTALPTSTPLPTNTPLPSPTPLLSTIFLTLPTSTPRPTSTVVPTATPSVIVVTPSQPPPTPVPTPTPAPTPIPFPTATPSPAATPTPTPAPTSTPIPTPEPTQTPAPTPARRTDIPPHVFFGSVTLNGAPASDGTAVTAWVEGISVPVGEAVVSAGNYRMNVFQFGAGSFTGKTITFKVGDLDANESGTWQSFGIDPLNLTVG